MLYYFRKPQFIFENPFDVIFSVKRNFVLIQQQVTTLPNDIVLRPRFQRDLNSSKELVLAAFEKVERPPFLIKRLDDHVFIKFNEEQLHFWSPQLHLEINEVEKMTAKLYGLFGPNPTLWTFFMFLHFGLATIFIIFGVWAYTNISLEKPFGIQTGVMILMIVLWIVLYVLGRAGKKKGRPQMRQLHDFMEEVLEQ